MPSHQTQTFAAICAPMPAGNRAAWVFGLTSQGTEVWHELIVPQPRPGTVGSA
jgi:hypothetical protein